MKQILELLEEIIVAVYERDGLSDDDLKYFVHRLKTMEN